MLLDYEGGVQVHGVSPRPGADLPAPTSDHWRGDLRRDRCAHRREWELDTERGAAAGTVIGVKLGAVGLRHAGGDRQSQAGSALLRREERLEDALAELGSDAGTGVGHGDRDFVRPARDCHANVTAWRRGLVRVHEQIQEQLFEILMIAEHAARRIIQTYSDGDALLVEPRLHDFERLPDRHTQVDGMLRPSPWMGQRPQPIDDALHALDLASDDASEV